MSFQDIDSDLSRLHRERSCVPVSIDPRTAEVLKFALSMAASTAGAFDPSIGRLAVKNGALPRPESAVEPDPKASWRDIELKGLSVRCHRPLWIDLGGIAKGYAVDRAVAILHSAGAVAGCVNAGGDLRVFGPDVERVALRVDDIPQIPVIELHDGALASSGGHRLVSTRHFDGRTGRMIGAAHFSCVIAPSCMTADALTKAALTLGENAQPVLRFHGAHHWAFHPAQGWRCRPAE